MKFRISLSDDIAACRALRRSVFIVEQGVSEADEVDELDGAALHLIARSGDMPVGTARIMMHNGTANIGRVCVVRKVRGAGLGAELIRHALKVARQQDGITRAKLGAQTHALGFYEKLGFVAFGPVYLDAGIEHRDMVHNL